MFENKRPLSYWSPNFSTHNWPQDEPKPVETKAEIEKVDTKQTLDDVSKPASSTEAAIEGKGMIP